MYLKGNYPKLLVGGGTLLSGSGGSAGFLTMDDLTEELKQNCPDIDKFISYINGLITTKLNVIEEQNKDLIQSIKDKENIAREAFGSYQIVKKQADSYKKEIEDLNSTIDSQRSARVEDQATIKELTEKIKQGKGLRRAAGNRLQNIIFPEIMRLKSELEQEKISYRTLESGVKPLGQENKMLKEKIKKLEAELKVAKTEEDNAGACFTVANGSTTNIEGCEKMNTSDREKEIWKQMK